MEKGERANGRLPGWLAVEGVEGCATEKEGGRKESGRASECRDERKRERGRDKRRKSEEYVACTDVLERRRSGREREIEKEEEEKENAKEEKNEVEEGDAKIGGLPLGDHPRPTSKLRRTPRNPPIQSLASLPTPRATRELRTKINMNV